jgi:hypothetical protein
MLKTFTFYNDPGHAWLRVKMAEIDALGIREKISTYSYVSEDGRFAYLEEDCDAGKFLDAFRAANPGQQFAIKESNTNSRSHIRDLRSYSVTA